MLLLQAFVSFLIAFSVAWLELVTSKYPRTIGLFYRSWALWAYAILYGVISFGFTLGYEPLVRSGVLSAVTGLQAKGDAPAKAGTAPNGGGREIHTPWLVAIVFGLSAKALMHIRLFAVPVPGSQERFPVGPETVVQLFEPWLLRTIDVQEDLAVSRYLGVRRWVTPSWRSSRQLLIIIFQPFSRRPRGRPSWAT